MRYRHPLPARLFRRVKKRPFVHVSIGTFVLYAVVVALIGGTGGYETRFPGVNLGSLEPVTTADQGVDPEPVPVAIPAPSLPSPVAPPQEPQFAAFVPAPAPRWPWKDLPGWEDAQTHPSDYANWLMEQHRDAEVTMVKAIITAYTPHEASCGASADGLTATLADAWQKGVAVPLPLMRSWRRNGTTVHVPGYMWHSHPGKAWKPDDCGSALLKTWKNGILHIDVRFANEGWARKWGVRRGYVFIVTPRK